MSTAIQKDVIILGGGIAGLWLLKRLRAQGLDAILFEAEALGSGQTIASQGMIHGGIKYALSGNLTTASNSIADMPEHWKNCIAGKGDVDLRGCRVLSQRYFMWPRDNVRSRLNAFLGSKALRGRVNALRAEQYPTFFRDRIAGPLYELSDLVLDVPSLLETLSAGLHQHIYRIGRDEVRLLRDESGDTIREMELQSPEGPLHLQAQRFIFTSGAGTEALLEDNALSGPAMQRRPLHMVMLKHDIADPLYVHCVADQFSTTPELTITTHFHSDGSPVWYLGGELAESGVSLEPEAQIARACEKVSALFPWCDFSNAQWRSFFIDRAEPRQSSGKRPDNAFARTCGNYMVCWPTKLTLAPALANTICQALDTQGIRALPATAQTLPPLPFPGIAPPPWETLF